MMKKSQYCLSLGILAGMFFIFGLVSWVNAILIPYFRVACNLTHFQSYFVTFAFYIAYFVMAVPSGILLKKFGYKKGMTIGFLFMSFGAFIFVAAAMMKKFEVFLAGLFSIGTGLAILQTAANPYVTIIGPIDRAARRISIMGVCNKFAGIIAPLLFAALIFGSGGKEVYDLNRVILPYAVLGVVLFVAGIGVGRSVLPEIGAESSNETVATKDRKSIFSYPYLWLGALAIFFHVGSQVIAIDTIIAYAQSMGMPISDAKIFPSCTLALTLAGYVFGIVLIPKFVSQTKMLIGCTILGLVLSACVLFIDLPVVVFGREIRTSILFLAALGLPNSLIYAGIWPLAIKGLGRHTKTGSSILIMGLCGNAILPQAYGYFADAINLHHAYWVLIPCFLYLIFFATKGHKIGANDFHGE